MPVNITKAEFYSSQADERLLAGFVYAFITVFMFIPYCISLHIIKESKSIYDPAFRLFALNMGLADLELMTLVGIFPAVTYFLPFPVSFSVYRVLGAFSADAWFTYAMLAQMMSLNRFIGVFCPVKAKAIYTRRNTLIILVFCWIQGLIWAAFYLKPNVALYFDSKQNGVMYDFRFNGTEKVFLANTMFNYAHAASLCLIYGLIYLKVRHDRKQILDPTLANNRKKENKVLIQACVICSMDIAVVATWAVFQKFATAKYALFIATIVALFSSGSTGYLYILMNSAVRQKFASIVSRCWCRNIGQTPNHKVRKDEYGIQSIPTMNDSEYLQFMDTDVML